MQIEPAIINSLVTISIAVTTLVYKEIKSLRKDLKDISKTTAENATRIEFIEKTVNIPYSHARKHT